MLTVLEIWPYMWNEIWHCYKRILPWIIKCIIHNHYMCVLNCIRTAALSVHRQVVLRALLPISNVSSQSAIYSALRTTDQGRLRRRRGAASSAARPCSLSRSPTFFWCLKAGWCIKQQQRPAWSISHTHRDRHLHSSVESVAITMEHQRPRLWPHRGVGVPSIVLHSTI